MYEIVRENGAVNVDEERSERLHFQRNGYFRTDVEEKKRMSERSGSPAACSLAIDATYLVSIADASFYEDVLKTMRFASLTRITYW